MCLSQAVWKLLDSPERLPQGTRIGGSSPVLCIYHNDNFKSLQPYLQMPGSQRTFFIYQMWCDRNENILCLLLWVWDGIFKIIYIERERFQAQLKTYQSVLALFAFCLSVVLGVLCMPPPFIEWSWRQLIARVVETGLLTLLMWFSFTASLLNYQ